MPLVATWCESDELFGKMRTYCHTFFAMADGGALAFFQFENPSDQEEFGPKMPASPFHHIALAVDAETQAAIEKRIAAAGIKPPDTYVLEHGYCRSVYVDGSQRADSGIHARSPRSGQDLPRSGGRMRTRNSSDGWRAITHRTIRTAEQGIRCTVQVPGAG